MSASHRDRRGAGLALALLALGLAACQERDVEVRPFHLSVTGPDGASLAEEYTTPTLVMLAGTAAIPEATALVVTGAVQISVPADPSQDVPRGDVTVRFDGAAAPDLAFPARLAGREVLVEAAVIPGGTGPDGEPLPVWTVRVATGPRLAPTYELALGEGTAALNDGIPTVPVLLGTFFGDEDLPAFEIEADWTDFEPAECGLVYLDVLRVFGPGAELALRAGATGQVSVGLRPDPWTVRHVLSYHRRGRCAGQSGSWTQIAAWR